MGETYKLLPHRNRSSLTVGGCISATERHCCHGEGRKDGNPMLSLSQYLEHVPLRASSADCRLGGYCESVGLLYVGTLRKVCFLRLPVVPHK